MCSATDDKGNVNVSTFLISGGSSLDGELLFLGAHSLVKLWFVGYLGIVELASRLGKWYGSPELFRSSSASGGAKTDLILSLTFFYV